MSYVDEPTVQKALHSALSVIDQGGYDGTRKVVQISILVGAFLTLLSALEDADDFVQPSTILWQARRRGLELRQYHEPMPPRA